MTTAPLQGRVALVTGAGRRTGRSIALALAGAGADVLVHCHHSQTEAQQVVQEISSLGRRAKVVQAACMTSAWPNGTPGWSKPCTSPITPAGRYCR